MLLAELEVLRAILLALNQVCVHRCLHTWDCAGEYGLGGLLFGEYADRCAKIVERIGEPIDGLLIVAVSREVIGAAYRLGCEFLKVADY